MWGARCVWFVLFSLAIVPASEARAEDRPDALFSSHNTYLGPVGGIRVVDAGSGPKNTFRIALTTEFFFLRDFVVLGDKAKHVGGALSLSYTAHDNIEVFGAFALTSTSNTTGVPELLQTLGDIYLGVKGFHRVRPWFVVGGDGSVAFLNSVGAARPTLKGISGGLRGNASFDMRELERKWPLIARFNLQYWFDNSANLVTRTENARYQALTDPAPLAQETRHLVSAVERFGLGINRTDFVHLGLGFEAPLELGKVYLSPLLEWQWSVPVNRQGFSCVSLPSPGDSCLRDEGIAAFPMTVTMGFRVLPPVRGLGVVAAAEVGVTGTKRFVRELAPVAPYRIWAGVAYAIDPSPPTPEPVVQAPAFKTLEGTVLEQGDTGRPVGGAVVRAVDMNLSPLVTDAQGRFRLVVPLADEIALELSHADYLPGRCVAALDGAAEGPSKVECRLELEARDGALQAQLVDANGAAVGDLPIAISGPVERSVDAGPDGTVRLEGLVPGRYSALVASPEYFVAMQEVDVVAGQTAELRIALVQRPKKSQVRVTKGRILLRSQVSFATGSGEILPNSEPLLSEVADVLKRSPDIVLVEVQGHTDNRGSRQVNRQLSQERADAVRRWLLEHGIAAERLTAKGYGPDRPLAPNITARNRARNRRVQFVIVKRAQ